MRADSELRAGKCFGEIVEEPIIVKQSFACHAYLRFACMKRSYDRIMLEA